MPRRIYRGTLDDTLAEEERAPLGHTICYEKAEALIDTLADSLLEAKEEALGHTLGYVEVEVQSTRWLTRLKMRAQQGHLTTQ